MMEFPEILLPVILLLASLSNGCVLNYHTSCGCRNKSRQSKIQGKKMDCHRINIADMFANAEFPDDIVLLSIDLTDNDLKEINKDIFGEKLHTLEILKQVIKLDMSNNKISRISPKSFSIFTNLTRLNLSSNSIGHLSADMFEGLPSLEVLDLSLNIFPIIPGDSFSNLPKLRKLYVKSTDFVCNCLMHDFKIWIDTKDPPVRVYGTCHLPLSLRGRSLRSLTTDDFVCDANNTLSSLPYFEITPDSHQLVFEGDEFFMQCEGTNLPTSEITWSFNRISINLSDENLIVKNAAISKYEPIIMGFLQIKNLSKNHSGNWSCMVSSEHGSENRVIRIIVISHNSSYCPRREVENNRGDFTWNSTVSGITKSIKCPLSRSMPGEMHINKAYRSCSSGNWSLEHYDHCPYKSKATRLIHNSLKDITSRNAESLVQELIRNLGLLQVPTPITESLTVQLISQLMERLMDVMVHGNRHDLGDEILGLASYAMNANASLLREAQKASGACDKILKVVRSYALKGTSSAEFSDASENIAVSGFMMESKSQYNKEGNGLTCKVSSGIKNFKFECKTSQFKRQEMQSSVSLPKSLLNSCGESPTGQYKLYFIAYRNGSLFQQKFLDSIDSLSNTTFGNSNSITQNIVLETGVSGCNVSNLSDPISFKFKTTHTGSHGPAVWSRDRGWVKDESCIASPQRFNRNYTYVRCKKLSVVTILYDPSSVADSSNPWSLANLAHPAVFAGTGILNACLIVIIMSYICCSSKLKISSDSRHMLVNICGHMLLVSCAFALGIWRVDYKAMCLACGIVLHYASLSILLWITISAKNIHKELVIHSRPPSAEPKPPRPMLRFYLIGCGIPTVICGITAAAKVQNYSGDIGKHREYCWLSWETSIFAFYLPAFLIAVVCVILLIRVLCALNQHSRQDDSPSSPLARSSWQGNTRVANGGDRYQAICSRNLDEDSSLHYSTQVNNAVIGGSVTSPSFQVSRSNEQSFKTQLTGVALLFVFFIMTWVAAALSVAAPGMQDKFSHEDQYETEFMDFAIWQQGSTSTSGEVFSYAYAVMAIIMGVFLLIQHLICRRDVRSSWNYICSSCKRARKGYKRNADLQSQATSAPLNTESDHFDAAGEHADDFRSSVHDKTSTPCGNKKNQREHQMYTDKTDPTTMETIFNSTTVEDEQIAHSGSVNFRQLSRDNSGISPHNMQNMYESGHLPCVDHQIERAAKSITSMHSGCVIKHSDHALNASFRGHSPSHGHLHHPYSHDHCMAMNSRSYMADSHHYHHGYHNHHTGHLGHTHQQHNKPVKMTNLHMTHDSSMTEHSFDEIAHNNMHTIPVVMQHHTQPKIDNALFYNRYQRMRKALEHKRARQKKLNVLREYAQDPLTSNEDISQKEGNINEASPLIQSPEKSVNCNGVESTGNNMNGIDNSSASKYRTLLIHSPSNKKHDTQKSHSKPNRRVKRGESNGQHRHLKGLAADKNGQATKRAKQNMRRSHNSTLSERERDTTSSEKSRSRVERNLHQAENVSTKIDDSSSNLTTANNIERLSPVVGSRTNVPAKSENHGYLTLQQLQNANPFLLYDKTDSDRPIVTETQNLDKLNINKSNNVINSEESEKDLDLILSSHDDTIVDDDNIISESSFQLKGSTNTVGSHSLPLRNETSV
ncbi:adhesion G protein-coupled receptor A3-like [Styela clava]